MFIPSIYKSNPQAIFGSINGTYGIPVAVNPNYTRLTLTGSATSQGPGPINGWASGRVALNSGSIIELFGLVPNDPFYKGATVLVEEFLPLFFRQAFYRSTITMNDATNTASQNTGLSLGPKAFVIPLGSDISGVVSSPMTCFATLTLSGSTVTAQRMLGEGTGSQTFTTGFMVIDPK